MHLTFWSFWRSIYTTSESLPRVSDSRIQHSAAYRKLRVCLFWAEKQNAPGVIANSFSSEGKPRQVSHSLDLWMSVLLAAETRGVSCGRRLPGRDLCRFDRKRKDSCKTHVLRCSDVCCGSCCVRVGSFLAQASAGGDAVEWIRWVQVPLSQSRGRWRRHCGDRVDNVKALLQSNLL